MKVHIKLTRSSNAAHFSVPTGSVVTLSMEDEYLPYVVANEIYESNSRTPMEAKKAQAVAARTYAAAHALAGTIMDDTANYQAFEWRDPSSIPNCMQAVRETEGMVLMHDNTLITAWYSASNGGRTKRSGPLPGHTKGADDAWSAYKPWTVAQDDPWDNAARAKWGETKRSHSVGMSQLGAAYAASTGVKYAEILSFYYPNTALIGRYGEEETPPAPEPGGDNPSEIPIETFPITVDMHTQNDCYRAARVRDKTHVIVHSTGTKGPAYVPRWQTWNRPGFTKCAHAFVDWNGIYQNLPWNYQGWLNGVRAGNDCSIAFEICEPTAKNDTPEMAADLYAKTLYLCTLLCKEFEIPPEHVICHAEAHQLGLANNHADVTHWWGKAGTAWAAYTMERLRRDVHAALGLPQEAFPYDAQVVTKSSPLNLWDSPAKRKSLAKVPRLATVQVLENLGTGWFRAAWQGVTGAADGQYLRKL